MAPALDWLAAAKLKEAARLAGEEATAGNPPHPRPFWEGDFTPGLKPPTPPGEPLEEGAVGAVVVPFSDAAVVTGTVPQ